MPTSDRQWLLMAGSACQCLPVTHHSIVGQLPEALRIKPSGIKKAKGRRSHVHAALHLALGLHGSAGEGARIAQVGA